MTSFVYLHVSFPKSIILVRRLADLDFVGTTVKVVIENSYILTVEEIKQKFLHQHFLDENHKRFVKDIDVCLIDKA